MGRRLIPYPYLSLPFPIDFKFCSACIIDSYYGPMINHDQFQPTFDFVAIKVQLEPHFQSESVEVDCLP